MLQTLLVVWRKELAIRLALEGGRLCLLREHLACKRHGQ
jgi:hypothetical protein